MVPEGERDRIAEMLRNVQRDERVAAGRLVCASVTPWVLEWRSSRWSRLPR
jgi:hypothetical protein